MPARILDGKQVAQQIRAEIAEQVATLAGQGIVPGLGVMLVGEDPASKSYVIAKEKACAEVGIRSQEIDLPVSATLDEILSCVQRFNADPEIDGILVQLPLPNPAMESSVISAIAPEKDVDCFHPLNVGLMVLNRPRFLPCTPHGIVQLLRRSGIKVNGAHVVVVGRSNIVGRPLSILLSQKNELGNATVTLCHTGTRDLRDYTRQADILVAAMGRPRMITADMVKPGAVVVDVGVNRVADPSTKTGYRLVGDVDFDGVKEVAGAITPVPGGVGPMTIAMLLSNVVTAARLRRVPKM